MVALVRPCSCSLLAPDVNRRFAARSETRIQQLNPVATWATWANDRTHPGSSSSRNSSRSSSSGSIVLSRSQRIRLSRATTGEEAAVLQDDQDEEDNKDKLVLSSVTTLKTAAKTKKVASTEVFSAIRNLEKARLDSSSFLTTIGGDGEARTWMLVFTVSPKLVRDGMKGGPGGGIYFPFTAVQKFDAKNETIENGLYLGPLGVLSFQGRFSWFKNRLNFLFDTVSITIGPLGPFKFNVSKKSEKERAPDKTDPFFIWYYADDEIIVGKGKGGGFAFWVRCSRVPP